MTEPTRSRAPCGDEIERADDVLVIRARTPIPDFAWSRYRPQVLLYEGERFVLEGQDGLVYRLRRAPSEDTNLYAPTGELVTYDGERHLERRKEMRRTVLAYALWAPTVPLLPFIGLLPSSWKAKLVHLGVNPGRATQLSIGIEWLLTALLVIVYVVSGGLFSIVGAVTGPLALFLALDIAYRVTADLGDGGTPGMFGVAHELRRWIAGIVQTARGKDRLLPPPEDP